MQPADLRPVLHLQHLMIVHEVGQVTRNHRVSLQPEATLHSEAREAKKSQENSEKNLKSSPERCRSGSSQELQTFDYQHFARSRYSITKIEKSLRGYRGDVPNATKHTVALQRLGEGSPGPGCRGVCTTLGGRIAGVLQL